MYENVFVTRGLESLIRALECDTYEDYKRACLKLLHAVLTEEGVSIE